MFLERQPTQARVAPSSVRERLEELGATMVTPERATPDYLRQFMLAEIQKWHDPAKKRGAVPD
jgi:hypothetical protein